MNRRILRFFVITLAFVMLSGVIVLAPLFAQTLKEKVEELKVRVEQGDAIAQILLAGHYMIGAGVPLDEDKASALDRGLNKKEKELLDEIKKSAERGEKEGQVILGIMYLEGDGVTEDDEQGVFWLQKAAEQDYALAQSALGMVYGFGEDVDEDVAQDGEQAVYWFKKAAEQNVILAQIGLGAMYAEGRGIPQDYVQAYAWINLAAAQGDKYAKEAKEILAKKMSRQGVERAQGLSRQLFEQINRQ